MYTLHFMPQFQCCALSLGAGGGVSALSLGAGSALWFLPTVNNPVDMPTRAHLHESPGKEIDWLPAGFGWPSGWSWIIWWSVLGSHGE